MITLREKPVASGYDNKLRIVILGYIVRGPLGGLVWHHLQYVLGLQRMGHDVLFVEDSDDYDSCYNPITSETGKNPDYGLAFTRNAFNLTGIGDCWAYHDAHTNTWYGPQAEQVFRFCQQADLLLNLSAVNPLRSWFDPIQTRVLIDTDPVFTQINHIQNESAFSQAQQHTHYFSFGENIGSSACSIPDDGLPWSATRQPVVIDCWNTYKTDSVRDVYTSILQWDSYPERQFDGQRYGMKSRSFLPLMQLPTHTEATLELAIGSTNAPRQELNANGWQLRDPLSITKTPQSYREYIQHSKAEFSIAKHGYVTTNSGWFSERSANYLASRRPVITQSTGFSNWLSADKGVLVYTSPEEALEAIDKIKTDYSAHCIAALEIAHCYFHHDTVLSQLLNQIYTPTELPEVVAL